MKKLDKALKARPEHKSYQLYTYQFKITEEQIIDGDTLKDVIIDLGFEVYKKLNIRLSRIDAPEVRTKDQEEKQKGLDSRDFLREILLKANVLTIYSVNRGKFGRWIAEIYADDVNVNDLMLLNGFAKPYL